MKRTLLGLTALILVVGIGSGGVYFAHRILTPAQTPDEPEQAPIATSRDMTPIPLARRAEYEQAPASDRFAPRSRPAESVAVSADRKEWVADARAQDDIPNANDIAADEDMPATRTADPFGLRQRSAASGSRYPEQPAVAEIPEAEQDNASQTDQPAPATEEEPQRVPTSAVKRQVDRYGRPLERIRQREQEPAEEGPPVVEPVADDSQQAPTGDARAVSTSSDSQPSSDEGTGRPGDPQLSGSQAPALTIEKTAPAEIQIGKAAKFLIKVRNAGSATAHGVEIHDVIPQGTQLIDTRPAATRGERGELMWQLGSLKPGDEQQAELQLMPTAEGEIGSVATVQFRAEASVRTLATKPMLNMELTGPAKVMKGEEVKLKIKIANPGTGAATGVVLNETVPQGLTHPAGSELEFELGTLRPGESRELELSLMAAAAGPVTNIVSAQAEANLQAEARADLEVIAPDLQVSMAGPKKRYLERNATYNLSVSNPGTATAKDIELVAVLPRELKFVEANNGGQFDAATHSVYWSLEELPPQETGTVTLTTLPLQPGETKLLVKGKAKQGLADEREETVSISGLAAINFQLSDVNDPIEAGGQTSYEVRVTNQGSKAASNVRVMALLPREMKALSAEGPVRYTIEGGRVVFEPLKQLAPKADTSYTIKVQALEPGDLRLHVQITTDEIREPISKEESTRVFGDE
ncbi:MAG: DUF11 domain-containing protein [Planctomycetia bacterium]|nr:DUF11 domain-containing protein [Planctomycetia bacterium]